MSDGSQPLKLYVNRSRVNENIVHSPLLFPFWGIKTSTNEPFTHATFNKLNFDPAYYQLVDDIKEADFIFLPHNYWFLKKRDPALIQAYVDEARKHKKPLLIDAFGDKMGPIDIPHSVILRIAQYRSRLNDNDVIIPTYIEDLLEVYKEGKLSLREKPEKPSIGFSGWVTLPFFKYPRTHLKDFPLRLLSLFLPKYSMFRKGVFLRKKATAVLERSKLITAKFIKRVSFSGHLKTVEGDAKRVRVEFVDNIYDTDYTLCVRGDANASTRLYEVLSLGRIPFLVDTECVFPLEDLIPYKEFCVFVDYMKMNSLGEELHAFHKNISPETFKEMQLKARNAFEEYLRIDVFTKYLMQELKNRAQY